MAYIEGCKGCKGAKGAKEKDIRLASKSQLQLDIPKQNLAIPRKLDASRKSEIGSRNKTVENHGATTS
jgi:hypothetical protein